jgi:glycosyltransferase involved in cell wall biosynthesis
MNRGAKIPHQSISLMLLAYNEIDTIEIELNSWRSRLEQLPTGWTWQIVVVEDGSTDGTTKFLSEWAKDERNHHLHEPDRRGYKNALKRGLSFCATDYIFFCDTGLKNDFEDFWALFYRRERADLLVGRKVLRTDSTYRQFLTLALNAFLRIYFHNQQFHDVDSGFRIFNRRVRDLLLEEELIFKGFAGCEMVLKVCRKKYKYLEVPISYGGRDGVSRSLPNRVIPESIIKLLGDLRRFKSSLN